MNLVLLVEDLSMKRFLDRLLPRIVPEHVGVTVIPHEGKSDLDKSLPRKLRAWRQPDTRFVILRDQDSGDCSRIKSDLVEICVTAGKPNALVRIACRELEAWYFGDLSTSARVLDAPRLAGLASKQRFRNPDALSSPSRQLADLAPGFGKVGAASKMGAEINLEGTSSTSFGPASELRLDPMPRGGLQTQGSFSTPGSMARSRSGPRRVRRGPLGPVC